VLLSGHSIFTRSLAPRGNALFDALRRYFRWARSLGKGRGSVQDGIPTQSEGTSCEYAIIHFFAAGRGFKAVTCPWTGPPMDSGILVG
jgi:hypothetical protein